MCLYVMLVTCVCVSYAFESVLYLQLLYVAHTCVRYFHMCVNVFHMTCVLSICAHRLFHVCGDVLFTCVCMCVICENICVCSHGCVCICCVLFTSLYACHVLLCGSIACVCYVVCFHMCLYVFHVILLFACFCLVSDVCVCCVG